MRTTKVRIYGRFQRKKVLNTLNFTHDLLLAPPKVEQKTSQPGRFKSVYSDSGAKDIVKQCFRRSIYTTRTTVNKEFNDLNALVLAETCSN